MAFKNLILDIRQSNGAKCCGQRQHATVRARKLLLAELLDKRSGLQVKSELLDAKILKAVIDLKDVIDIEVAGIMC